MMREWSKGLLFASFISVFLVAIMLIAACEPDVDVDVDRPKVHSTKTYNVKPPKKAPAVKVPSYKKKK